MGREARGRRGLGLSGWSDGEEPSGKGLFTAGPQRSQNPTSLLPAPSRAGG